MKNNRKCIPDGTYTNERVSQRFNFKQDTL